MTPHDGAVALLRSWHAPSEEQEGLRAEYVGHLEAHPDGLLRSCRPDHITASTLVMDPSGTQVLLTLHAKAQEWFQFGGHIEPDDAGVAEAALREVSEESGLAGLSLDPSPLHLDTHEVPFCRGAATGDDRVTRHLDVRFLAVAPAGARPVVSEESADVRWWPVDALPTDEASLRALVDLGRERLAVAGGLVL